MSTAPPPGRSLLGRLGYLEEMLAWLLAFPTLPLQIVAFWLISWGGLGGGLGLDDLLWNDDPGSQMLGGTAVSLLFAEVLFIRYLLDPERRQFNWFPYTLFPSAAATVQQMGRFLLLFWPPLLAILTLPKLASAEFRHNETPFWPMLAGAGVAMSITFLVVQAGEVYGIRRRFEESWILRRLPGLGPGTPEAEHPLHALAGLLMTSALVGLLVLALVWRTNRSWSPVLAACLLLGLFNAVMGFVRFHLRGVQYFLLIAFLATAWYCNRDPYKLTIPALEEHYREQDTEHLRLDVVKVNGQVYDFYHHGILEDPDHSAKTAELIDSEAPLRRMCEEWQKVHGANSRPRIVLIATSGGGIRAAVWTSVVLEGLQREIPVNAAARQPGFVDHIRLITGASGGMVGATMFVADYEHRHDSPRPLPSDQLAMDSLGPALRTALFNDLRSLVMPQRRPYDRGRALEDSWADNTRRADGRSPMERSFKDLSDDERAGRRPSLVYSPMLVEDARRLLISNLDLNDLTEAYCARLMPDDVGEETRMLSLSAVELRRLFPSSKEMRVATAARLNATFPYVSPGVSLPTYPPRRVVDAGYYDNFGVNIAAVWVYRHREALRRYTSGVVLVEIRAYRNGFGRRHFQDDVADRTQPYGPAESDPDQVVSEDQQKMIRRSSGRRDKVSTRPRMPMPTSPKPDFPAPGASLSFLTTPIEALIANRGPGTLYRDDEFLDLCDALVNERGRPPLLTTVALECGVDAALSWHLPAYEVDAIRSYFYRNPAKHELHPQVEQQVKKLKVWFGEGGGTEVRRLPKGKLN